MGVLEQVAPNLVDVLHRDFWWMGWNTFLAWIPVGLAYLVFRGDRLSRSPFWWAGLVLFVLFLPNAPYVVTDLVHLRGDIILADRGGPVVTAILPVYAVLIGSGFLAYYLALSAALRHLTRIGYGAWQFPATIAAHALCAIGIFLGRWARLNSWEPVVEPHATLERIVVHLTWAWAPVLILATFLVTWTCHFMAKAIAEASFKATLNSARHLRTTLNV
ncbi:DUF1361 domain-containing protein [Actinomadura darangshiensis]|uniref:DUF1361 domain-containing protein n=1 Tax=Actinomadura darangshiensis TaxID=705336 RepID=A0A4R5AVH6_9ACTN|nr:DUF1361 domain-containing protein [Actinomadura darangshiensis]TDD74592.1 DUF1361 domain-containing protein [Actinomadura darangshiensis]